MDQEKSHHAVAKLTFGCKKFKKLTASRHFFKLARSYKSHLALAKRHLAVKIVKPSHAGRISILQLVFFLAGTRNSTLSPFVANSERFCDISNLLASVVPSCTRRKVAFSVWQGQHLAVLARSSLKVSALVWEGWHFWSRAFQTLNCSLCVAGATLCMIRVDFFSWQVSTFLLPWTRKIAERNGMLQLEGSLAPELRFEAGNFQNWSRSGKITSFWSMQLEKMDGGLAKLLRFEACRLKI